MALNRTRGTDLNDLLSQDLIESYCRVTPQDVLHRNFQSIGDRRNIIRLEAGSVQVEDPAGNVESDRVQTYKISKGFGKEATQAEIYEMFGARVVKFILAGFNSMVRILLSI